MSTQVHAENNDTQQVPNQGMLFFDMPAVLTLERHAEAGVSTAMHFNFTKNANSVPLNLIEFTPAAKNYPILFTSDEKPVPIVALGMGEENYFIQENGHWETGAYVPAYIRQYPFAFYQQQDDDTLYLCVDEGSDKFHEKAKEGDLKFYENGEATEDAKNALEFCKAYFQHMQKTRMFCDDLKKHGLLTPQASTAAVNGKEAQLTGFQIIDEQRFNALSDDAFLELRKKGWLGFIYTAMGSATNWNALIAQAHSNQ